jgi:glycosyltransferase involved in cell wall biosynthesis
MESRLDFEMDIVGEDTLHGEIQAMAEAMGLSRAIRFRGFLPHRQLRPLVEQADLLIHSSRYEAGPLVMLEAAVAGIPTVGTAVGHIAEWAPDAAVSVPVGDSAGLAGAISRLLLNERVRFDIASEAMRRAVREDADYTAERFRALYRGLI